MQPSSKSIIWERFEIGKKTPVLGKLVHQIGIVLLFLVGLSGFDDILSNKRALTTSTIRQRDGLGQIRGSIEGWDLVLHPFYEGLVVKPFF